MVVFSHPQLNLVLKPGRGILLPLMRVLPFLIEPNCQLALLIRDHLPMLSPATHHVLLQIFESASPAIYFSPLPMLLNCLSMLTWVSFLLEVPALSLWLAETFHKSHTNMLGSFRMYFGYPTPWTREPLSNKTQPTLQCRQFETSVAWHFSLSCHPIYIGFLRPGFSV